MRFQSLQKHKQDSLNINPKTHNHLTLTKAQKCNHFFYLKSLILVVTPLIPLKQLTAQI